MAPSQTRKGNPVAFQASEYDDAQSSPDVQIEVDVIKSAQNIVSNHKKRRDAKRKALEGEHEKCVKEVRGKIDRLFDDRKSRVTKSQKELWHRLDTLNKKRQTLETLILTSIKSIETHTGNMTSEIAAMFTGRIEEVEAASSKDD